MSRMLSFTPEVYYSLFEQYHRAIWPAQILLFGLCIIAFVLAFRPFPQRDRIIGAVLALVWLWVGIGYHHLYFTQINFIAPLFAVLFVIQGMLFAWAFVLRGRVAFRVRPDIFAGIGLGLAIFAIAIDPLFGWLAGHAWPRAPMLGVTPNPTAIFTWGMLLLIAGRTPLHLTVIPLIWSLIGGATAWLIAVPEDASLPIAAAIALPLTFWKNRRAKA